MMAQFPEDAIRAALARVEARLTAPGLSPLSAPAGDFRWALQDASKNVPPPSLPGPKSLGTKKQGEPSVMERFLAARAQEALAVYKALDEKDRKPIFEAFKEQHKAKALKLDNGASKA